MNYRGKKILLKGNHDYWWTTITNMRNFLKEEKFEKIDFLHNNSYCFEDKILVGTRGWSLLETENSKKMIQREKARLKISIEEGRRIYGENKPIIVFMHYPPINKTRDYKHTSDDFMDVLKEYSVKACYYGHLHGSSHKEAIEGEIEGISFHLISADYLNFSLKKIMY